MKSYTDTSNAIRTILKLKTVSTKVESYTYTDKLSKNPEITNAFISAFSLHNKSTLIVAPTGSGKTYTIDQVFQQFGYDNGKEKVVNLLVVPNRIQNVQNQTSYKMIAIIGGSAPIDSYDFAVNNSFSVVADKAKDVVDTLIKRHLHVNLCIDEADTLLVGSIDYRYKAIQGLHQLISTVKKCGGSVVYMTATPEPLLVYAFDKIIYFSEENKTAPADKLSFVTNAPETRYEDGLCFLIKDMIKSGKRPFVRLNDIDMIRAICTKLSMDDGYTCLDVDSSQKGGMAYFNPFSGEEGVSYNNEIFDSIVNNSTLPDTNKTGSKINAYFTTSMIEVGCNIIGIGPNKIKDNTITPVFACNDAHNCTITGTQQFFARIRYHVAEYVYFIGNTFTLDAFSPLEDITKIESDKLDADMMTYITCLDAIRKNKYKDETEIADIMQRMLSGQTVHGHNNDRDCISYSNGKIDYDTEILWKHIYDLYVSQFYKHSDVLAQRLSNSLSLPLEIIHLAKNKIDGTTSKLTDEQKKQVGDIFCKVAVSPDLQKQIIDDSLTDDSLQIIARTKEIKDMRELIRDGMSADEAAAVVSTCDVKEINRAKRETIRDYSIRTLQNADKEILKNVLDHQMSITAVDDTDLKKKIHAIIGSDYAPLIRKAKALGIAFDSILTTIVNSKRLSDVKRHIRQEQCRKLNNDYINNGYVFMPGIAGREQAAVLALLLKKNQSGHQIQWTLSDDTLDKIANRLNESISNTDKPYTAKDAMHIIRDCFTLRRKDTADGKVWQISNVRL